MTLISRNYVKSENTTVLASLQVGDCFSVSSNPRCVIMLVEGPKETPSTVILCKGDSINSVLPGSEGAFSWDSEVIHLNRVEIHVWED
jgi:hypothetical protein